MEKKPIEIKITNVFGYLNMFMGTILLAIFLFSIIAMAVFLLFNFKMLNEAIKILTGILPAVFNSAISLIVGVGIVEKKKWGWKVGFFYILYWIVYASYGASYNIVFNRYASQPIMIFGNLLNFLFIAIVLWAFTRPKVKALFSPEQGEAESKGQLK